LAKKDKGNKVKKPGRWTVIDLLFGILGLAAIAAVTYAAFLTIKWVMANYL
jgi:hypothetical protein